MFNNPTSLRADRSNPGFVTPDNPGAYAKPVQSKYSMLGAFDSPLARGVNTLSGVDSDSSIDAVAQKISAQTGFDVEHVKTALKAAQNAPPGTFPKDCMLYTDMSRGNNEPRGMVFNMKTGEVMVKPFTVAAGSGSGLNPDGTPASFGTGDGTHKTELGLFKIGAASPFTGHANGTPYNTTKLTVTGLNENNFDLGANGKWVHGAPYCTDGRAGTSHGCTAIPQDMIAQVAQYVGDGGAGFTYAPLADMASLTRYRAPSSMFA